MKKETHTVVQVSILSLIFFATTAFSWKAQYVVDAPIRWHSDSNTVGFKMQLSSIPPGSPQRAGIVEAIQILNENPSNIRARINSDTEWVSVGNGQNEVWFTDNSIVHGGAPALCIRHYNPFLVGIWNLMEADVIFNPDEIYTNSRNMFDLFPYGAIPRPIQTTALHEFGHAMGLEHENRIYNIMGEDWTHVNTAGSRVTASRGPDMSFALESIYGGMTSPEIVDLSVSHFKYLGVDGEYSTHQRTVIGPAISGESVGTWFAGADDDMDPGQLFYSVRPGQTVTAEFTLENNGLKSVPGVRVRYVLSTNKTITTLDRTLLEVVHPFPNDRPVTKRTILRIPSDVSAGTRMYIGIIIDANDAIAESTERNNATFIPIQID
jgi:hypothetical protein